MRGLRQNGERNDCPNRKVIQKVIAPSGAQHSRASRRRLHRADGADNIGGSGAALDAQTHLPSEDFLPDAQTHFPSEDFLPDAKTHFPFPDAQTHLLALLDDNDVAGIRRYIWT